MLITPYLVGLKNAKELLMLGEQIDASTALRMGLVNRVVPVDELLKEAKAMARKLADLPQSTVRLNKLLVNRVYDLAGFREALNYRDDPDIGALVHTTPNDEVSKERLRLLHERGWAAFLAKRDAMYNQDGRK